MPAKHGSGLQIWKGENLPQKLQIDGPSFILCDAIRFTCLPKLWNMNPVMIVILFIPEEFGEEMTTLLSKVLGEERIFISFFTLFYFDELYFSKVSGCERLFLYTSRIIELSEASRARQKVSCCSHEIYVYRCVWGSVSAVLLELCQILY